MTFLKPITVWRDIVETIRAYRLIRSPQGYFVQTISVLELGVPLLLAGFAGILLMLRQRKTRTVVLGWIFFATVLIAAFLKFVLSTVPQFFASRSAIVHRGRACIF
jgi:hypothetical protein